MIDTSNWKEFRVGDLFNVSRPASRSSLNYKEGDMPFVASGNFNNGVTAYLQPKDDNDYDEGSCITVSAVDGYAFYQKDRFLGRGGAGSSIIMLRNDNLNELNGKYICTLIRKACNDWEYSNMGNKDKLADTIIWLPITSDGQPDWDYMESYMKTVLEESEKSLENLRKADDTKHLIDVSEWGEFRVGDLFDIHPTSAYKVTNVELLNDNGSNPVVANSGFNNGIVGYTDYECNENAGVITFTDTAAKSSESFFYQEDNFVGYPHVQGMYCKSHNLNEYEGKYMTTVLRSAAGKFDFITKMTREVVKEFVIKLPITSTGEPDWRYMEDYMKQIMDKSEQIISDLQTKA